MTRAIPLIYAVPTAGKTELIRAGLAVGWLDTDDLIVEGWPAGARLQEEGLLAAADLPAFYHAATLTVASTLRVRAATASGVLTNILAEDLPPRVAEREGPRLFPVAIVNRAAPEDIATLMSGRGAADALAATIGSDAFTAAEHLHKALPGVLYIQLGPTEFLSDVWDQIHVPEAQPMAQEAL